MRWARIVHQGNGYYWKTSRLVANGKTYLIEDWHPATGTFRVRRLTWWWRAWSRIQKCLNKRLSFEVAERCVIVGAFLGAVIGPLIGYFVFR